MELLTKKEAAEFLRLSERTISTWIKEGSHAGPLFRKIGESKWMIPSTELETWVSCGGEA